MTPQTGLSSLRLGYLPLVAFETVGTALAVSISISKYDTLRREADIRRLAEHDHLTGLYNARVLDQVLSTRHGANPGTAARSS